MINGWCFKSSCNTEKSAAALVITDLILSPITVPVTAICILVKTLFVIIKSCFLCIRGKISKDQILKHSNGEPLHFDLSLGLGVIPFVITAILTYCVIRERKAGTSWLQIKNTMF